MIRIILSTLGIFMVIVCSAQKHTIMGTVTDFNDQPLVEVKVWYSFDGKSSFTDIGGLYKISLPENVDTLYFTKPGYAPGRAVINKRAEINIRLDIERVYDLSFEDLLNTMVSTVSLREQNISDAPGVVTVITHEELSKLGVRTIKDALTLVPGYSLMQNDDEQIFSVRGIFATTNQKILVMRDGHSLNEGNLDIPQTEYSLSIQNIEKIEIIRGPGASIYGNSALASIVNIITKNSESTEFKAGIGNYGQFDIDFYSSNKLSNTGSLLIFGRYANVKGQSFPVNYGIGKSVYKGTYKTGNYPDNYDVGFKYRKKSLSISFSTRRHEYRTYWTAQGFYTNTDSLLVQPGLLMNTLHVNMAYEPKIRENLSLHLIHFIDEGQLNNTRLLSPIDSVKYINGRVQMNQWNVARLGTNYYSKWGYSLKGQMLAGFSFEQRNYYNSWLSSNTYDSSAIILSHKPFYPKGREVRGAAYIQAQHELFPWLKFDIGLRYDIAQNFKSSFNPRIALIASPLNSFFLKLMYTEAFQAPGYSYRTSNADFSGSISDLEPEKLSTLQASLRYNNKTASYFELAAYYNRLNNLITRTENNYYANFGKVASYGFEFDVRQSFSPVTFFFNYSMLLPDTIYTDKDFKNKNIYEKEFRHFSKHVANGGLYYDYKKLLEVSMYGQFASGFSTIQNYNVDNRLILNTSIQINLLKNVTISLNVYNVFDKRYKLGDPSVIPIEQPGRWWQIGVLYGLK